MLSDGGIEIADTANHLTLTFQISIRLVQWNGKCWLGIWIAFSCQMWKGENKMDFGACVCVRSATWNYAFESTTKSLRKWEKSGNGKHYAKFQGKKSSQPDGRWNRTIEIAITISSAGRFQSFYFHLSLRFWHSRSTLPFVDESLYKEARLGEDSVG